jgi:outer membrane protein assembly factor BamB
VPSEPVSGKGEPPPDLRTRKSGSDWAGFLGPLGTSISTEKGILTKWPGTARRIVWSMKVGTSYAMPSISRGRLFLFDRHGDAARLSAFESETGKFLWKFEYPTNYEDFYGYNNGPRCCPS